MEFIIFLIVVGVIYKFFQKPPGKKESYHRFRDDPNKDRFHAIEDNDDNLYYDSEGQKAHWYGLNETVKVQSHTIPGGLIYVGSNLKDFSGYRDDRNDACLVNPKLNISSANPWEHGEIMGYWPYYSDIPAKCRGAYLKWLASGRSEPETNIGYVFLFFYGLERRLIVDASEGKVTQKEKDDVINEILRLISIYKDNRSFIGYARNLLAMEWVFHQNNKPIPEYLTFDDRYCSEPFQMLLAKLVVAGKPIPPKIALQWYRIHPDSKLRTPARRCVIEFEKLFSIRYLEKFGDGLMIEPNKTRLKIAYYSASPSLRKGISHNLPDLPNPFILTGPIKKIAVIVEDCTNNLEAYSRYLGRKNNDPKSLHALSLIPKILINKTVGARKVKERLSQICSSSICFLPLEDFYKKIGQKFPIQLKKKDLENLSTFIDNLGYGVAPDVRFHNMKPALNENIVIFPKGHGIDFNPSKEFRIILTILRLGSMVSQIDNDLDPSEEAVLKSLVQDNRELTNIEKESLLAFLYWCIRTPQTATGLKARLSEISATQKAAISHILISVAHADGRIDPSEVKQLEKLYTTLGLNKAQVANDIHTMVTNIEPITVSHKDSEKSFAIPKPVHAKESSGKVKGFILNDELIKIREEETKQVKGVLEKIFTEQDDEPEQLIDESAEIDNPLEMLDEAHQKFFNQLITQETWERVSLQKSCQEMGLMIDGAFEVINEWAFENTNVSLIDDGEPVYVDITLAKEIVNG